ncbi:MAG: LysM peptidoglycan-binding domain-containing protein [Spongiibacteraceae bacterium]|nr:LysM peptidoglycan-binding domain-containing protein [Spongiibacteraceae bacterium]
MIEINTMIFNTLRVLFKLISISVVAASCTTSIPVSKIDSATIAITKPITINHNWATQLLEQYPRELFTDFNDPYQCLLSIHKLPHNQARWAEPSTVWQRIRIDMTLDPVTQQGRINSQFNWYKNHPEYMARVSKRAERYIYYVTEQVAKRSLPMELSLLPIVESAYDPFAYSHGRASGLWQFIPGTARQFKLSQNWWYDGRRDIVASTDAALTYLTNLNTLYKGDWLLALAAYNSGQGTVSRAIRKNKKRGKPTDFWSLDLPKETRSYVPKLLALAKLIKNPQRYGIKLYPVANQPYFTQVNTQSQIDLAQAARMAELDIDEIYRLNPGFNRWATAPSGPHYLLVPVSHQTAFEQQLSLHPPEQRLHWKRYKIQPGDPLLLLAKRFNTSAKLIRQTNDLRSNVIRTGQSLMIPLAAKKQSHYTLSAQQRQQAIQQRRRGTNESRQLFHTVKNGDSLWGIAKHHQVKVASLAKWNGIAPKDMLIPGQKLSIWTTTPVKQSKLAGGRNAVVRKIGYKVRSGDSLAKIAQRFNLRIKDIVKWNAVNTKKYLYPGQKLTLHVDITNSIN